MKNKLNLHLEICIVAVLFSVFIFGQTKQEHETRINKNLLPERTQIFVSQFPKNTKRLRFYKEIDGEKESFEVKFKYDGNYYSTEFDTDGNLEDVEKLIKTKIVPDAILDEIERYFEANFRKSKILKTQEQFIPDRETNDSAFLKTIFNKKTSVQPNYEIIAEVTKGKDRTLKEFLFNAKGKFLNMRDIARSSYGHVLY